jgi:hypothetical protein
MPCRGLYTWHSCHCHNGAWDEKLVGGDSANLIVDGITMGPVERPRLELRWELSQTNTGGHTPLVAWQQWRESPLVGGTSCPPIGGEWRCSAWRFGRGGLMLAPLTASRGSHLDSCLEGGGCIDNKT